MEADGAKVGNCKIWVYNKRTFVLGGKKGCRSFGSRREKGMFAIVRAIDEAGRLFDIFRLRKGTDGKKVYY